MPGPPASGAPPRPALTPKPRVATRGSREAGSSSRPQLPTSSARGDRKGLFVEKGESSLKTDMVVLSCYLLFLVKCWSREKHEGF